MFKIKKEVIKAFKFYDFNVLATYMIKKNKITFINRTNFLIILLLVLAFLYMVITVNNIWNKKIQFVKTTNNKFDIHDIFIQNDNQKIINDELIFYFDGYDDKFLLNAKFLIDNNIKNISIDDDIISDSNIFSGYEQNINGKTLEIISKFQLKPKHSKIKFVQNFTENVYEYNIILTYRYLSEQNKLNEYLWKIKYKDNLKLGNNSIVILPCDTDKNGHNSLIFKRRFDSDIFLQFEVSPIGEPLIFTVNLSEGTQVAIGDKNIKSVRLVQAIDIGHKKKGEKEVYATRYNDGFRAKKNYLFTMRRIGNKYLVDVSCDGLEKRLIEYKENKNDKLINEKYKNIVFAVWRGSKGIKINKIIIGTGY